MQGIQAIQDWLAGPPLNLQQTQLDAALQQVTSQVQEQHLDDHHRRAHRGRQRRLRRGHGAADADPGLLLRQGRAAISCRGCARVAGDGAGGHLAEVLRRVWKTLGGFIRTQAVVSLVDAVLIGIGLVVLGRAAGAAAGRADLHRRVHPDRRARWSPGRSGVLVALVSNGFTTALIVLIIIVAVQQLEGNVLQPMLQSRSLGLHAVVVLLAVTAGSTLYGIAGAFLAVPVVAAGAVVLRYLGERVDDRAAGGPAPRVDPPLETVQTVVATPGGHAPDGTRPDPDAERSTGRARYTEDDTAPEDEPPPPGTAPPRTALPRTIPRRRRSPAPPCAHEDGAKPFEPVVILATLPWSPPQMVARGMR